MFRTMAGSSLILNPPESPVLLNSQLLSCVVFFVTVRDTFDISSLNECHRGFSCFSDSKFYEKFNMIFYSVNRMLLELSTSIYYLNVTQNVYIDVVIFRVLCTPPPKRNYIRKNHPYARAVLDRIYAYR